MWTAIAILPAGILRLRTPAKRVAHFDAIFSDAYRATIAQALPRTMFVRDQGVMLGKGEVWFDAVGKVIVLNH